MMMATSRIKLLLVEDSPPETSAIARLIRDRGLPYEMEIASSSATAAALLLKHRFHVALLDYRLPDGTAFDLFTGVGSTPIILLTETGSEEVADLALRRGAYDYLIKDDEGNYLSLLPGTIHNVIRRKRAEDALRESEARFQDLFNNAPDMYFLVSNDGSILSVNRQIRLMGYDATDLIGQSIRKLIHSDDEERIMKGILASLSQPDDIHSMEFRMVKQKGEVLHVSESHTVQPQRGNRPPVIRLICRDITERMQAEQRERELQERLARSERMKSLGVLAGGVAHDLNNILGPMVAYPDLLMRNFSSGSREYEDLREIKHSAGRAVEIVRDLLTLARRGRSETTVTNLNYVIKEYMESAGFNDIANRYPNVRVQRNLARDLSVIDGSTSQIMKAVMNLIINAFESMFQGGTLSIESDNVTLERQIMGYDAIPSGDYVVLRIIDSGSGIRPEIMAKIFEPFYSNKKLGRSGSGLGLAVVYGVVRDHKGYIDVKSKVGEGTSFSLYFPKAHGEVKKKVVAQPALPHGNERILVVDDIAEQLAMAERLLSSLGYQVDVAQDGHAALRFMQEQRGATASSDGGSGYDLLVLDMLLEDEFDGLEAYREILKEFPKQRCIIVSGVTDTERVEQMQALGAGLFIRKPYTLDEIGHAVRQELDKRVKKSPQRQD